MVKVCGSEEVMNQTWGRNTGVLAQQGLMRSGPSALE